VKVIEPFRTFPVEIEPMSTTWVLDTFPRERIYQGLCLPVGTLDGEALLHPLWSQYLRETDYGLTKSDRRVIPQAQAVAFFGSIKAMFHWFRWPGKMRDVKARYLPEFPSIVLEYTFPELFKGISREKLGHDIHTFHGTLTW
jgi:hypothetical protein